MSEDLAQDPPAAVPAPPPGPPPQAWGAPLYKIDQVWTRFETGLVVVVLCLEAIALTLWVALKSLSTPADGGSQAGIVFRGVVGAIVLGCAAWFGLRKQKLEVRRVATVGSVIVGALLAKTWGSVGVGYMSNLLNWYQQACTLTLFGGLRGIGTQLTLLLTLLGGSLATARGKHITVDLVQRFVSFGRVPIVIAGWVSAAVICGVLSWGFFDHIAIENFGARLEDTPGQKAARVVEELGERSFILRKQIALDFKAAPHVLFKGEAYSDWLGGKEWNSWLREAGFVERYGEEAVKGLEIPEDDTRAPFVVIPGRGEPRGELSSVAYLMYPIGFLVIALRFLMRSLLAASRHVSVDPDDSGEFTTDEEGEARV